ncbi:unannotated protein [freshwater metagenome]|uniref:Unannotated protein n=1 Tax=freshwater metagenome TaxID=449393 RepID=A0A6J6NRS4_9ZZZZ
MRVVNGAGVPSVIVQLPSLLNGAADEYDAASPDKKNSSWV